MVDPDDPRWTAGDEETPGPRLGGLPIAGLVRRARRLADLSQRELATHARVSRATVARIEAGSLRPSLAVLQRVLVATGLRLVVVDHEGHLVLPMRDREDLRDGAERRYPAHLDTIVDPRAGEWWGDIYGLSRPPETYRRDRRARDYRRRLSQQSVRSSPGWT